jgi:AcrR family transcriptional regulator
VNSRPYRSELRAGQARATRRRILDAAHDTFVARGYAGTTLPAVAGAAGVSVKTVELGFRTKAALLAAVVDVATAGDDVPVPMLERDAVREAAAAPDAERFTALVAALVAEVAGRVAGILAVVAAAAPADRRVADLAAELDRRRTVMATWVVDGLAARAALRPGLSRAHAVDAVWILMDPGVHRRLTRDRGWTADDLEAWFAASFRALAA